MSKLQTSDRNHISTQMHEAIKYLQLGLAQIGDNGNITSRYFNYQIPKTMDS